MARSRKKTPMSGITSAKSEKADKLSAHRKERRKVRSRLSTDVEPDILPHRREVGDVWSFAKDGKKYQTGRANPRDMRK
jgi:hypothetical protein